MNSKYNIYCVNCNSQGHNMQNCKNPITSLGIICIRINKKKEMEYLMVRRKDSLGYVDFIRGKYSEYNDYQLKKLIDEMTYQEIYNILHHDYHILWNNLWKTKNNYDYDITNEEKFKYVKSIKNNYLQNTYCWKEPEWGFPKGRPNFKEKELECALREFQEETGYPKYLLELFNNVYPVEEIFTGSNFKSYRHKYFISYIDYDKCIDDTKFQKSEIGDMKWVNYEMLLTLIRPYNIERIQLINKVHSSFSSLIYSLYI